MKELFEFKEFFVFINVVNRFVIFIYKWFSVLDLDNDLILNGFEDSTNPGFDIIAYFVVDISV